MGRNVCRKKSPGPFSRGAAIFRRDSKSWKQPDLNNTVVDGMLNVMNTLCQALTPTKQVTVGQQQCSYSLPEFLTHETSSAIHSSYLKQLSELRDLYDIGVLHEEQRSDLVNLLRKLK